MISKLQIIDEIFNARNIISDLEQQLSKLRYQEYNKEKFKTVSEFNCYFENKYLEKIYNISIYKNKIEYCKNILDNKVKILKFPWDYMSREELETKVKNLEDRIGTNSLFSQNIFGS